MRIATLVFITMLAGGNLYAQECSLTPRSAMKGDTITVAVSGVSASLGTLTFNGANTGGTATSTVALDKDPKTGLVPRTLNAGNFTVSLTVDKKEIPCGTLSVTPERVLKLFQFDPSGTDKGRTLFVKDEKGETTEQNTVQLTLNGSGFLTGSQESENIILLDNKPWPVQWDNGCTDPALNSSDRNAPLDRNKITHAHAVDSSRIELCDVPISASNVVQLTVKQAGLAPSQTWPFRFFRWSTVSVGIIAGLVALLLALLVLSLVRILKSTQKDPSKYNVIKILFLDLETNTYSLSKFQFYWWTAAALFGYAYLVIGRMLVQGQSWPDMPPGLPAIIGIGAGTSVGAVIASGVQGPKGGGAEEPSLGDLVTSGGAAAPDRVQMLVWTILGVSVFCISVLGHQPGFIKDLDPVPTGILYMMGLSSIGYLGGKLARKGGPLLNDIQVTPQESDDTLNKSSAPPIPPPPNLAMATDQATTVLKSFSSIPTSALPAVQALTDAIAVVTEAKTLAATQLVVPKLIVFTVEAEKQAKVTADAFALPASPPEAQRAAEISQRAAGALHELTMSIDSTVTALTPKAAKVISAVRVIELRGRNLSNKGLVSIGGVGMPFRMLLPNPDANNETLPEIAIREPEDPNLAVVLRLSMDACNLQEPDFRLYQQWFKSPGKKTFAIQNLDGQRAEISFELK